MSREALPHASFDQRQDRYRSPGGELARRATIREWFVRGRTWFQSCHESRSQRVGRVFPKALIGNTLAWSGWRARPVPEGAARVRAIVHAHWDAIYHTTRRLGVAGADIEDIVQEVLVVVVRRHADIEVAKERAFVVGATVRVVANWRRRARRHPEEPSEDVGEWLASGTDLSQSVGVGERRIERSRQIALLSRALAAMTEAQRVAFVLFELEEWTAQEVAKELGVSEVTVVSRVRRAREVFWRFREQPGGADLPPQPGAAEFRRRR
jgi:RNA polymerase sigma-70 factor (ECF subfamily)